MRFSVTRLSDFSSAHYLPEHPHCGQMHGHNYRVEVTARRVTGGLDPQTSMVVDFAVLDDAIEQVTDQLDHKVLNEVLPDAAIPTAEYLAMWLFNRLADLLYGRVVVEKVVVWENDRSYATAEEGML
jgi:6-pyruvoyltetrahydropterin/6-carboxytetrahydropterin synthase